MKDKSAKRKFKMSDSYLNQGSYTPISNSTNNSSDKVDFVRTENTHVNAGLVIVMNDILSQLIQVKRKWFGTIDKIHRNSASLLDACLDLEDKIQVFQSEQIIFHDNMVVSWDSFQVLMKPLWKANQDFLPIYNDLDSLYDSLVDFAKPLTTFKIDSAVGIDVLAQMKKMLNGMINKPKKDGGDMYYGEIYRENITSGQVAAQDLKEMCILITKNIAKKMPISDQLILEFKSQVKEISCTLIEISQKRQKLVSQWVMCAISDIELFQTKLELNLTILTDDE